MVPMRFLISLMCTFPFLLGCAPNKVMSNKKHQIIKTLNSPDSSYSFKTIVTKNIDLERTKNINNMIHYTSLYFPIKRPLTVILWNNQQQSFSDVSSDYCLVMSDKRSLNKCILKLQNASNQPFASVFTNYSTTTKQSVIVGDNQFWHRYHDVQDNKRHQQYLQIAAHEYYHAYQNTTAHYDRSLKQWVQPVSLPCNPENKKTAPCYRYLGPIWLTEGSAELVGVLMAAKAKKIVFHEVMSSMLIKQKVLAEQVMQKGEPLSLKAYETSTDIASVKHKYTFSAHYEMGAWAVLYLMSITGPDKVLKDFYQDIAVLHRKTNGKGWQAAFRQNFGMEIDDFYAKFKLFNQQSHQAKMQLADKVWRQFNERTIN